MKIGVVADTHIPSRAKKLPTALVKGLQGVDLILHAGDWVTLDVARELEKIAPVDGVAGNNDGDEIVGRFGRRKVLSVAGFQIGIVHGDGRSKSTERRAWETFKEDKVHIIVFGHSHIPLSRMQDGVLLFNPGSPTDKRRQSRYSYGIIELTETIGANHFFYSDKS